MGDWKDFFIKALEIVGIYAILRTIGDYIYKVVYNIAYKEAYTKGAHDMEVEDTRQLLTAIKALKDAKPESACYLEDLMQTIGNKGVVPEEKKSDEKKDMVIEGFKKSNQ